MTRPPHEIRAITKLGEVKGEPVWYVKFRRYGIPDADDSFTVIASDSIDAFMQAKDKLEEMR